MKINTLLLNAQTAANTTGVKDCRQTAPKNHTFSVTFSTGSTTGVVKIYGLDKATDTVGAQIGGDFDLTALTAGTPATLEVSDRAYNAVMAKITTVVVGGASPSVTVRYRAN